ncbi:MAG: hypothetical protein ACI9MC_003922, partial [Kiritimatiellia bacterium]
MSSPHQVTLVLRPTDVIVGHPRVRELGRSNAEQGRVDAFAQDVAWWLVGGERQDLAPLARVVSVVAQRELRDARVICRGNPLVAVEAGARAVQVLWPLLREDSWVQPSPLDSSYEASDDVEEDDAEDASDDGEDGDAQGGSEDGEEDDAQGASDDGESGEDGESGDGDGEDGDGAGDDA